MRTRLTRAVLIVTLAGLGVAAPAHATLVFQTGEEPGQIRVAADDGSGARNLVAGAFPHISPDGQTVAYLSNADSPLPTLRVIPTAGGTPRTIVKRCQSAPLGAFDEEPFDWSSDSRHVVVVAGPDHDGIEDAGATIAWSSPM